MLEYGQVLTKKELDKLKYGWSKHGGPNHGLVKQNLTEDWTCQSCAGVQAKNLPSYMFEFADREFIRICAVCQSQKLSHDIILLEDLIKHCRKA